MSRPLEDLDILKFICFTIIVSNNVLEGVPIAVEYMNNLERNYKYKDLLLENAPHLFLSKRQIFILKFHTARVKCLRLYNKIIKG